MKKYMKRNLIIAVVVILIAGGSFYGGMTYAKSQSPRGAFGSFAGRTGTTGGVGGARTAGSGITTGQILSSDPSSLTVQMQNGSTQIVLISTSTQIVKSTVGTSADLSTGTNVVVTGSQNSDGSLTAQSIQIRPVGMNTPNRYTGNTTSSSSQ